MFLFERHNVIRSAPRLQIDRFFFLPEAFQGRGVFHLRTMTILARFPRFA